MNETTLLSDRFRHTGEPAIDLNDTQKRIIEQVEAKIKDGTYTFDTRDCPLCKNDEFERLAEQDRYGLSYPVSICRECGLVQAMPRMDEGSYTEFYQEEYRLLYDGTEDWEADQFESQYERACAIDKYLGLDERRTDRVVDIGAGPGGMLGYFQEQGHPVEGCDLDPAAVDYARAQGVPLQRTSVEDLDLKHEPDVVILSHILEHFLEPVEGLQAILDIGEAETRYFIEVPGLKSVRQNQSYYGGDFRKQLQNAHTYYFSIRTLKNTLRQAGFEPIDIGHAPALEREDEFGHIRATCVSAEERSDEWTSDYAEASDHLRDLEASEKSQ